MTRAHHVLTDPKAPAMIGGTKSALHFDQQVRQELLQQFIGTKDIGIRAFEMLDLFCHTTRMIIKISLLFGDYAN